MPVSVPAAGGTALTVVRKGDILRVMAEDKVFSDTRREFIARSVMDVVKLIFVAAVVGGFFVSAPIPLRLMSAVILLAAFVISVITFPRKEA